MGCNLGGKGRGIHFYADWLWGMISFLIIICNNDFKQSILCFLSEISNPLLKFYILHYAVLNILLTSPKPQGHFQTSIFYLVLQQFWSFCLNQKAGILFRWLLFKGDQRSLFLMTSSLTNFVSPYTHSSEIIINNLAVNGISISLSCRHQLYYSMKYFLQYK